MNAGSKETTVIAVAGVVAVMLILILGTLRMGQSARRGGAEMKKRCFLLALMLIWMLSCVAGCGPAAPSATPAVTAAAEVTETPAEEDDPGVCTYRVVCYGAENAEEIEGVIVNFCTDTSCVPVVSGETGEAVFTGPPAGYHVQIIKVPEGWVLAGEESEWTTGLEGETFRVPFREAGK